MGPVPRDRTISVLPPSLAPRGLSRGQAAEYVGVSPSKFDEMVSDGRMPRPKRIDARTVWDRVQLDEAFSALEQENAKGEAKQDLWRLPR
jgi:predicted DNA-binding transcriptional regulator AlpA